MRIGHIIVLGYYIDFSETPCLVKRRLTRNIMFMNSKDSRWPSLPALTSIITSDQHKVMTDLYSLSWWISVEEERYM